MCVCVYLAVPSVGLWSLIVPFPDHTHLFLLLSVFAVIDRHSKLPENKYVYCILGKQKASVGGSLGVVHCSRTKRAHAVVLKGGVHTCFSTCMHGYSVGIAAARP